MGWLEKGVVWKGSADELKKCRATAATVQGATRCERAEVEPQSARAHAQAGKLGRSAGPGSVADRGAASSELFKTRSAFNR